MCERAKAADPNVLLSFENPVGMMELTEGAREGLEKGLGLTKLEVSYCKFAFGAGSPYVKKPTHFWTNSPLLIANFGEGKFTCSKYGCSCGDGYHHVCGFAASGRESVLHRGLLFAYTGAGQHGTKAIADAPGLG